MKITYIPRLQLGVYEFSCSLGMYKPYTTQNCGLSYNTKSEKKVMVYFPKFEKNFSYFVLWYFHSLPYLVWFSKFASFHFVVIIILPY